MTRNYIITADGTKFIESTKASRSRRRLAMIVLSIIAAPFIIAALTGVIWAISEGAPESRPDAPVIELDEGAKIKIPSPCILHWDSGQKIHEVRCDG